MMIGCNSHLIVFYLILFATLHKFVVVCECKLNELEKASLIHLNILRRNTRKPLHKECKVSPKISLHVWSENESAKKTNVRKKLVAYNRLGYFVIDMIAY